jgi:bacterioferritin-associated ferredoxin
MDGDISSDGVATPIFHCYCTGVTQKRVLRAMAEQNVTTAEEARTVTGACTGCRTCWKELETLVDEARAGRISLPRRCTGS